MWKQAEKLTEYDVVSLKWKIKEYIKIEILTVIVSIF
nr:MAG TPA: hypothetical protein [Caudoviricetes sp.]